MYRSQEVSSIRNVYILILICIVSLALHSPVSLNIHNRYQRINLISPICFIHGGKWNVIPDQEIYANVVMRNSLEFDSGQNILEGALVYKIQRQHAESDKFIQAESKSVQLLIAWRVDHTKGPHLCALLIEHDKEFNCDEDKLRRLYQKCWHPLNVLVNPIGDNWLLDGVAALTTTAKATNGGYRLDIFISEGKGDSIKRPLWIDAER
jgi:hypothetical protein